MPKFICPHCGVDQRRAALELLQTMGQAFFLEMNCGNCGVSIRWTLTYALVIDTVTAQKEEHV